MKIALETLALVLLLKTAASQDHVVAPPPPYLMGDMHSVTFNVLWEPETVDALLPEGITPVEDYAGGVNLYYTSRGYGITPFSTAYVYVSVQGYDSSSGEAGRFMLQGYYGPDPAVTDALKEYFALPVSVGMSIQESSLDDLLREGKGGTDPSNDPNIRMAMQPGDPSECFPVEGFLNYISNSNDHDEDDDDVVVLQIPYATTYCPGTPVDATLFGNGVDEPLDILQIKEITAAGQNKNAIFTFAQQVKDCPSGKKSKKGGKK